MSVIVAVKVSGDTGVFTKSLEDHAEEYRKIAERAKEHCALHHQFGVGEGYILINDEWESAQEFESFFSDPALRDFMGTVGADLTVAPQITVGERVDSPDMF
jgi:quinol monooxygenase YgiN